MRLATHPTAAAQSKARSNNSKYGMIALFLIFGLLARHQATRFLTTDDVRAMSTDSAGEVWSKSINEYDPETGFTQSIVVTAESPIYQRQSAYQSIEVHESHHFGKILVLDGVTQLTERDGDSYNEMMAHMPLFQHPNPQRVLVLGGGDGYIVSEVLKHPSVVHVDHVDLDRDVIATCQKFFSWGAVWEDPRVTLHIEDGAVFVQNAPPGSYDVVIQDSSDPWTRNEQGELVPLPSGSLYVPEHYSNIYRALAEDGILNFQAETIHIPSDLEGALQWRMSTLASGFERVRYGSVTIATYPTGQIGFLLCEKRPRDPRQLQTRYRAMVADGGKKKTTYYHPKLQTSSFDLPLWVEEKLYGSH